MINDGNITTDALNGKIVVTNGTRDDDNAQVEKKKLPSARQRRVSLMSLKKVN